MQDDGRFEPDSAAKGLILLVDDEKMIRDIGRDVLEALGYQVLTARGGRQALKLFDRWRDRIDIVILDLSMPDMDGEATFDALWETAPGTKVILSSGYSLDAHARRIMKKGCCAFLQKPFKMAVLARTIEAILNT